jgi:hypothetical protein
MSLTTKVKITVTIEKISEGHLEKYEKDEYRIIDYESLNIAMNRVNKLLHLTTFQPNLKIE